MEEKAKLTPEEMTQKRLELLNKTGNLQFTKAVIEAELLQLNQQILNINNELTKNHIAATTPAPSEQESPSVTT